MANKRIITISALLLFLFSTSLALAQSKNDKTVVGTVGDEKITYGELVENFSSGSQGAYTLSDLKEFLPIYLNYKAKLHQAKEKGYYQDSAIVAENKVYTKQAAYAFWLEKQIKPTKFDEYYERANTEIKAAHVLINLSQNASDQQVEQAVSKLKQARQELLDGASFEDVDQKYSSKRQGRSMGGQLPWLSVGRTVKSFEDVVYDLDEGEISEPFKTRFGYHIAILLDRRPRAMPRRVKHIFVRSTPDTTAEKIINEAYQALEEGRPWNDVTMEYSQDNQSKRSGGVIGWVNYGSGYNPDFTETVMNLDPKLDYTEPVRTNYGYHIFNIDSVRQYASEEEKRKEFMEKFEDTPYFEKNNSFVINYLREQYPERVHEKTISEYKQYILSQDSTIYPNIQLPKSLSGKLIYEFNGEKFTAYDYHEHLQDTRASLAPQYNDDWFDKYVESLIDERIVELTKKEHPQFSEQVTSYLSGLVIYKINDDSVWSSATVDTSDLTQIYENNPEKYSFDDRHYYHLISARHDSTLQKVVDFVESGNSPDSIRANFSTVAVISDSTNVFDGEPYDKLDNLEEGTFSEVFEYNKRKAVFYVNDLLPARRMTFKEAFNRLLADYQPEREEKWLENLRKKYSVKANYKKLEKAFEKDPTKSS